MRIIACIVLYIIGFYISFKFFIKKIYLIMAVNQVAIPTYKRNKDFNILPFLGDKKRSYLLIIGALIISMFNFYTMIVAIPSFILSFIAGKITFNKSLFEESFYAYAEERNK